MRGLGSGRGWGRGWALESGSARSGLDFGKSLPTTVGSDVQDSEIAEETEAGGGMADDGGGASVAGLVEVGLGVEQIASDAATEFHAELLFLDAAFGELDAEFGVLEIPFGLIEGAEVVEDLEFELFLGEIEGAFAAFDLDEGLAVAIAFALAIERQVRLKSGAPAVLIWIGEDQVAIAPLIHAGASDEVHFRA